MSLLRPSGVKGKFALVPKASGEFLREQKHKLAPYKRIKNRYSRKRGIVGISAYLKLLLSHPANKSSCLLKGEKTADNGYNHTHPIL